ncbi:MAG TPA: hypothetical protein PK047_10255 [Saprospiraceae bacterium]|nr:hypothetical protein [Saprospiraceae bacterium]HRO09239.1 hypothetical protein [Saprospiraceae bacterium]HRP42601.1 hypothetical protein [Saprospiraceae bacterium]
MLDKCRLIYKGDIATAKFYILVAGILLFFAVVITIWVHQIGYRILSIGLYMLAAYCLGKGFFMWFSYRQRLVFYNSLTELNPEFQEAEKNYTEYRIHKKQKNRRGYVYVLILSCFFAFAGAFSSQKGLIMGTAIPIALISGIEISMGLLTEFRLNGFLRLLRKQQS